MNIYKFGTHSYEENYHVLLIHDNEYSEEEFDEICLSILESLYKRNKELGHTDITVDELRGEAIERLEELGFKPLKEKVKFSLFGWKQLNDKRSWPTESEEKKLKKLTERIE
jgi:hypothetical protein